MNFLKTSAKKILLHTNLLHIGAKLWSAKIAILRYHSVQENPEDYDSTIGKTIIHPTYVFERQMELIARKYNPISLDLLSSYLKGEQNIPDLSVVVTFDDGYLDNYEIAAPILNKYGIQGTFYVTVDPIEKNEPPFFVRLRKAIWSTKISKWQTNGSMIEFRSRSDRVAAIRSASNICAAFSGEKLQQMVELIEKELNVDPYISDKNLMMSWEQIKKLHNDGHLIGSHTLTHPNVVYITEDDLKRELIESKKVIEERTNALANHFSYPNPSRKPQWNDHTNKILKQAGYLTAVNSTSGSVKKGDDPFQLNRVYVPMDIEDFKWYLDWAFLGRTL